MADTPPIPDRELVQRTRAGDAGAFDTLVRRYYRAAYAVALSACGNPMDAEDVCQDAFIKALERIDDCRDPARVGGWLLRIVRNRAHNVRDYQRVREGPPVDLVNPAGEADTARATELGELRERLEEALAALTPMQREVVLLHDLDGWKHREIAAALGTSEGMARQHLFNARKVLRARLGQTAMKEHMHHD
jgi:RNA polymerase sigma-70 factor, ECF subfamily